MPADKNLWPVLRKVLYKFMTWMEKHPRIQSSFRRLAKWHDQKMGYQKYGLLRDDLINYEHEVIEEAISRLSDKEIFDRSFRQKRAMQLNLIHDYLPKDQWTKPEDDRPYLFEKIFEVCRERDEKNAFDNIQPNTLARPLVSLSSKGDASGGSDARGSGLTSPGQQTPSSPNTNNSSTNNPVSPSTSNPNTNVQNTNNPTTSSPDTHRPSHSPAANSNSSPS